MIGFLIPGWLKRAAAWAVGLALALFAAWGMGKREGRIASQNKTAVDAAKRVEKGRKAVAKADPDASPDDTLRKNDGRWK